MNKKNYVVFVNKTAEELYEKLKDGKYESKKLYEFISRAINDLKQSPSCGIKIPKRLWPQIYVQKYDINNLWKYDLPNGWRLIYTIKANELEIINIILEWFDHKGYERKFRY